MIKISVAGLCVGLESARPCILAQCRPFLTEGEPDLIASATPEEIEAEYQFALENLAKAAAATPDGQTQPSPRRGFSGRDQAEFICLHRSLAFQIIERDRFLLHGAVIQVDGKAYIFTARSGVGKTTHIRQWMKRFGSLVRVVNGDKPILWKKDGVWLACGTPWCGKEGMTSRDCVPVAGLCFLERSEVNEIRPASSREIVNRILHQIARPPETELFLRELTLLDDFLTKTPCWVLGCTPTQEAAETSYAAMIGTPLPPAETQPTNNSPRPEP